MLHRRIEDVLRGQELLCLPPTVTVQDAAEQMAGRHVATVLITEGNGKLDGIFTERDMVVRVVAAGLDTRVTTLAQVMTRDLVTIGRRNTVMQALHEMERQGIRHLPVVENGLVIGVVSMRDFVGEEVAVVEHEREIVTAFAEHMR
ncbi:CBS domain protein [uncultured Gammaproteobacteria bacterium]